MQLEHQFSVPVPIEQAWDVLLDVERIAPCMPGATVDSFDGETIEGRVKVKVGPIQVTYAGTASFTEKDEAGRRAVIDAKAKEARGPGTAAATIVAVLHDDGGTATSVTVSTDLTITGRPAQFGRGVMVEVGNKILGKFADCLAAEIGESEPLSAGLVAGADAADAGSPPTELAGAGVGADEVADSVAGGTGGTGDSAGKGAGPAQETRAAAAGISATTAAATPAARPGPVRVPLRPAPEAEAIDLLGTAGLPMLKRLAPVVAALVLLLVAWRLMARARD